MPPLCLLRVAVAAAASLLLAASAQAIILNPPSQVRPTVQNAPDCDNTPISPTRPDNGFLVHTSADSPQHKQWVPRGADFQLTVHLPAGMSSDDSVHVCLRWHTKGADEQLEHGQFVEASARIDSLTANRDPVIVATIPDLPPSPPRFTLFNDSGVVGVYTGLYLVPIADVRILVVGKDNTIKADIVSAVGVTARWWAMLLAVVSTLGVLAAISIWCRPRTAPDVRVHPLLRIITTASGYASLSQFQIVLWTFVVGASVIYVMALSGELIAISTGTLVLLGISGTVTLGSQIQDNRQQARDDAAQQKAALDPSPAAPPPAPADPHTASLRDLITDDGEVDVTRLQMLYFTVVSAAFVAMTVLSQSQIPEIPQSFLILMGISNGVYLAAKFNK